LDGSVVLAPVVTGEFWDRGFGQSLRWRDRTIRYRMTRNSIAGTFSGRTPQRLLVHFPPGSVTFECTTTIDGRSRHAVQPGRTDIAPPEGVLIDVTLPATREGESCAFRVRR
jgi:hypothetical protein